MRDRFPELSSRKWDGADVVNHLKGAEEVPKAPEWHHIVRRFRGDEGGPGKEGKRR
jgi:hypothetical protein